MIVVPLNNLQKKDVPFRWTDGCQTSFDNLKGQFITAPILGHFNPQSATTIETDALDYAMGAVFNQIGDDGLIHPIAFISRTLQPAYSYGPWMSGETSVSELILCILCISSVPFESPSLPLHPIIDAQQGSFLLMRYIAMCTQKLRLIA